MPPNFGYFRSTGINSFSRRIQSLVPDGSGRLHSINEGFGIFLNDAIYSVTLSSRTRGMLKYLVKI